MSRGERGFRTALRLEREGLGEGVALPASPALEHVTPFLFDRLRPRAVEVLGAVFFDREGRALGYTMTPRSGLRSSHTEQRHLVLQACACGAAAMVVFRSRPGGSPRLSEDELAWTMKLLVVAAALGVRVLDHLTLGRRPSYESMRRSRRGAGLRWDAVSWRSPERIAASIEEGWRRALAERGRRRPARVKYRDPETGRTWSGRGSMAKWLAAHVAAGRDLEEFAVEAETTERRER